QWNAAFGTPPSTSEPQPTSLLRQPAPGTGSYTSHGSPTNPSPATYTKQESYSPHATNMPPLPQNTQPVATYTQNTSPYTGVTPTMWQELLTNTIGDGNKRRWNLDDATAMQQMQKRQR
ncbi:hypothetical protein LTS18_005668, partial [Coniosporium uncinatum]